MKSARWRWSTLSTIWLDTTNRTELLHSQLTPTQQATRRMWRSQNSLLSSSSSSSSSSVAALTVWSCNWNRTCPLSRRLQDCRTWRNRKLVLHLKVLERPWTDSVSGTARYRFPAPNNECNLRRCNWGTVI